MDIRTQSALLAAIVSGAIAVSMLLRPQRPRVLTPSLFRRQVAAARNPSLADPVAI